MSITIAVYSKVQGVRIS